MKSVLDILEERISAAMAKVTGRRDCAAIVRPTTDAKFGDYQANGVMALAKQLKTQPRVLEINVWEELTADDVAPPPKLAQKVVEQLDIDDICEPPKVAGPGFINLRLKPEFAAGALLEINKDAASLGLEETTEPKTIVVDFSSPNIAKEMHVGHLRSTIIGDCICRVLECLGHKVIRQNHIGDWGTQFGMLTYYLDDMRLGTTGYASYLEIPDMEQFYKQAKKLFDANSEFASRSREYVVKLQSKETHVLFNWEVIREQSISHCQKLYEALGVTLTKNDVRGESEYNEYLPSVIQDLRATSLAVESEGAICVFPEGFKNKEGKPLPFIIQKSDGAYLYATTDLAALRYRVNDLKADAILYVTDARQIQHFQMLFKVADMSGWNKRDGREVELVHVTFGSILGDDGAPLKTRSGENVKLKDLLDEAVERAKKVVEEKNPDLSDDKKAQIARAVGIGAVKYADYSNNRTSDYVFSFDKMLAMDGNTAPYMQYAYARICSIMDKGKERGIDKDKEISNLTTLSLTDQAELELAKHLIRYGEAIEAAAADYRPNYLTAYLYELSQKFSAFYTNCPVLAAGPDKRPTRLLLCDLTARTIRHGLHELLGIEVVEQM